MKHGIKHHFATTRPPVPLVHEWDNSKKAALVQVMLTHPKPRVPISLPTDASEVSIGAVLQPVTQ